MQCAEVYLFNDRAVIAPQRQTTAGVWITDASAEAFELGDASLLGKAVLDALSRSRQDTPHPSDWKTVSFPVPRVAGARSLRAFMQSARHVAVEASDGRVTFRPSRNMGVKEGFEPMGASQAIDASEPDNVGTTLLNALSAAE